MLNLEADLRFKWHRLFQIGSGCSLWLPTAMPGSETSWNQKVGTEEAKVQGTVMAVVKEGEMHLDHRVKLLGFRSFHDTDLHFENNVKQAF